MTSSWDLVLDCHILQAVALWPDMLYLECWPFCGTKGVETIQGCRNNASWVQRLCISPTRQLKAAMQCFEKAESVGCDGVHRSCQEMLTLHDISQASIVWLDCLDNQDQDLTDLLHTNKAQSRQGQQHQLTTGVVVFRGGGALHPSSATQTATCQAAWQHGMLWCDYGLDGCH